MSEIKALDSLRKLASDFRSDVYKRDEADYVLEIANEIEREISERYMPLPVDADGVPIHVGDELEGNYTVTFVSEHWVLSAGRGRRNASRCRHIKPDPLKKLLHDACTNATRIRCVQGVGTDISIEVDETELASYAERIRELLGDDNPRKAVER